MIYEYLCPSCGVFEIQQKISDAPLKECRGCQQPVQKLISRPAYIIMRGQSQPPSDIRQEDEVIWDHEKGLYPNGDNVS